MTRMSTLAVVPLFLLLTTAACMPHQARTSAAAYDDATISTHVKTALLNDPQIGALRIDVSSSGGVVTLSGVARSKDEEQKAIAVAKQVPGVKDVKSNLKVGG